MRALKAPFLALGLLSLGITIILTTNTGHGSIPEIPAIDPGPSVWQTFRWSMAKRFGLRRRDGIVDYRWNGKTYEESYVNPASWKVDFDACGLDEPGSTFAWEIDGLAVANPNPSSCRFSHEFQAQGNYAVRLTRTSSNGTSMNFDGTVTVKDLLIVSLGDSFASGQGNPDIRKNRFTRAEWVDENCARSAWAGPAQAAIRIEDDDPHTSVTFVSFACTGAGIEHGILKEQIRGQVTLRPQIDRLTEALKGRPIDALIISAGGNDIGFADLVASCIRQRDCSAHEETVDQASKGLDRLEQLYVQLSQKIAQLPSVKKVFITEYPDLVRNGMGELCHHEPDTDPLRFISRDESEWASQEVIAGLNLKVREAATRHNWVYVTGISEKFRTNGFCARREVRWVRTYHDARSIQGADGRCNFSALTSRSTIRDCLISSGTFHPNERGHHAYAMSLIEALRQAGVTVASSS